MAVDQKCRQALLKMKADDLALRCDLEAAGQLERGYHPEMAAVHQRHADALRQMISDLAGQSWPGKSIVGADGAEAAWLILQHAIGDPDLQRSSQPLLAAAVAAGEAPPAHLAYLEDRIACYEGRPQKYGTQSDYDAEGYMAVCALEDPARVDVFRQQVGLPVLHRISRTGQKPMEKSQLEKREAEVKAWYVKTGWREKS